MRDRKAGCRRQVRTDILRSIRRDRQGDMAPGVSHRSDQLAHAVVRHGKAREIG